MDFTEFPDIILEKIFSLISFPSRINLGRCSKRLWILFLDTMQDITKLTVCISSRNTMHVRLLSDSAEDDADSLMVMNLVQLQQCLRFVENYMLLNEFEGDAPSRDGFLDILQIITEYLQAHPIRRIALSGNSWNNTKIVEILSQMTSLTSIYFDRGVVDESNKAMPVVQDTALMPLFASGHLLKIEILDLQPVDFYCIALNSLTDLRISNSSIGASLLQEMLVSSTLQRLELKEVTVVISSRTQMIFHSASLASVRLDSCRIAYDFETVEIDDDLGGLDKLCYHFGTLFYAPSLLTFNFSETFVFPNQACASYKWPLEVRNISKQFPNVNALTLEFHEKSSCAKADIGLVQSYVYDILLECARFVSLKNLQLCMTAEEYDYEWDWSMIVDSLLQCYQLRCLNLNLPGYESSAWIPHVIEEHRSITKLNCYMLSDEQLYQLALILMQRETAENRVIYLNVACYEELETMNGLKSVGDHVKLNDYVILSRHDLTVFSLRVIL